MIYWYLEAIFYAVIVVVGVYALFTLKVKGKGKITKLTRKQLDFAPKRKATVFGKNENRCREILQKLFNKSFISCRPDFLRNPATGQNLEIDCYNEELKLALEYDGKQHYQYVKRFHKNSNDFFSQVLRDDYKNKKLKDLGIKLIRVPYYIKFGDLESYITKECNALGLLLK